MKTFKVADYSILIINLIIIAAVSFIVYSQDHNGPRVIIETEGEEWVYPLEQDKLVQVNGFIGRTTIIIKDGRVRIKESPCADHVCVFRGWMQNSGEWAACLPNGVIVSIEGNGNEEIDAFNR